MSDLEKRTQRFVDFDRLLSLSEPRKFREKAVKFLERKVVRISSGYFLSYLKAEPVVEHPKILPISDRIVELAKPFIRDQPVEEALLESYHLRNLRRRKLYLEYNFLRYLVKRPSDV